MCCGIKGLKERIVQEIGSLGENQSLDLWLMEY